MKKKWYRQKTFWAGLAGLVAAAQGFMTGAMGADGAIQLAVTSIIGIFLRQGVEGARS